VQMNDRCETVRRENDGTGWSSGCVVLWLGRESKIETRLNGGESD
jgi:hypothetical protein